LKIKLLKESSSSACSNEKPNNATKDRDAYNLIDKLPEEAAKMISLFKYIDEISQD
jgi:hypothetical protein